VTVSRKGMDLQQLLDEKEWRRCKGAEDASPAERAEAFAYFCCNYWYIKHPERGRILFDLREAQLATIEAWIGNRYSIVLKARQIGFSTLGAAYSFWLAYFWSDRFIVMLSRTEREAAKLLLKSKYGFKFLPEWMRKLGPMQTSDNQLKMTFDNDSAIESLPSGNDPARGESVYLVIVDEWAFLPNAEEAWASIEPIADVGGRVIGLSTANGSGNFYHQLWVGATTGTNHFFPIFWPWSAGDRGEDWYAAKVKSGIPSWQLHQEYPRNAEEAFIKSGNPVFDVDALMGFEVKEPVRGWIDYDRDGAFHETVDGSLAVWQFPEPGCVYVIGADVAEGLGYGDYSSAHVVDANTLDVVAHYHGHIDPDRFGDLLASLGKMYNGCLVAVENNNHGLTTLKAMQRAGYKNLYRTRRLAQRTPQPTEVLGWRTTAASKPLAIDELAAAVRNIEIGIYDKFTIGELKTYVRTENGKTHGSPHDDRVMSLAITWQMLKHVWLPEYIADVPPPRFSVSWFEKFVANENLGFERVPLGSYNVPVR